MRTKVRLDATTWDVIGLRRFGAVADDAGGELIDPNGNRTRVAGVKSRCPNRWTMGPCLDCGHWALSKDTQGAADFSLREASRGLKPAAP